MLNYEIANSLAETKEKVDQFKILGYLVDDIYVFAYNERQSEQLIEETGTNETSLEEHSLIDIMAFFHTSRGEELRDKMVSLGLSEQEAERLEKELEKGQYVILGCKED